MLINAGSEQVQIDLSDAEIISEDIPGWLVANEGSLTVALDINLSEALLHEGIAREFVNRIQNFRKDSGLDVTDKIELRIENLPELADAVRKHTAYIAAETLCGSLLLSSPEEMPDAKSFDLLDGLAVRMALKKI
jgi:isoleucyl-tRNA synthetase